MPLYNVQLRDGSNVQVEAPEGATRQQLATLINQQRRAVSQAVAPSAMPPAQDDYEARLRREIEELQSRKIEPREEAGFGENILTGFGAGVVGAGELAALGAASLLDEETELAARDRIRDIAEYLRPEGGDPESLAYQLSSGLGSIASFAVPGAGAAGLAARIAGGLGRAGQAARAAQVAGLTTGAGTASAAGAGEARERARAAGATPEEMREATMKGALIGLTEVAPLGSAVRALRLPGVSKVLDSLGGKIDAETFAGRLGQRIRSAGITGVAEGSQEAAAAVLQNLTEQGYNPTKELFDAGIIDEATIGGGAGAILQALVDVIGGRRVRVGDEAPRGEEPGTEEPGTEEPGTEEAPPPPAGTEEAETQTAPVGEEPPPAAPERTPEEQAAIDAAVAEVTGPTDEEVQAQLRAAAEQEAAAEETAAAALDAEAEAEAEAQVRAEQPADTTETVAPPEQEAPAEAAPVTEPAAEPAPAPTIAADTVLDDEAITNLGVPKSAKGLRNKVRGKVASSPEVVQALKTYAGNPRVNADVSGRVSDLVATLEAPTSEPVATVPEPAVEPGAVTTGVEPAAGGVSPADSGAVAGVVRGGGRGRGTRGARVGPEVSAPIAQAPQARPVAPTRVPAAVSVDGAGAQPSALTTDTDRLNRITDVAPETLNAEEQAVRAYLTRRPKDQKLTEERISALGIPKAAPVAKKIKGKSIADEGTRAALQEYADNPDVAPETQRSIQQLLRAQLPGTAAAPDLSTSLRTLAYDLIYRESDSPLVGTGGRTGSGVKAETTAPADAALKWVRENGSPELNSVMDAEIDGAVQALESQYKNLRKRDAREAPGMVTGRDAKPKSETRNELLTALEADVIDVKEVKRLAKSLPAADSVGMLRSNADLYADTEAEAALNKFAEQEQQRAKQEKLSEGDIGRVSDRVVVARRLAKELKNPEPNREAVLKEVEALRTMKSLNVALDSPLADDVVEAINSGNLGGALAAFAPTSPNRILERIATRLSSILSGTRLVLAENLTDAEGKPIAGQFDPTTNTITLDASRGVNGHTLMHEAIHAAVSATLANPNSPLTRRMTALFNNIRDIIDTAYGGTSLDEFVSEAMSNVEFQQGLATLTLDGKPISAWDRFKNAVANFLRGLINAESKPVGSVLDEVDRLVNDMVAPAPEFRDAGALYAASRDPKASAAVLNNALKGKPKLAGPVAQRIKAILDSNAGSAAKRTIIRFMPLNNLVEFARPYLKSADGLLDIIRRQGGAISRTTDRIRNTITPVAKWAKSHQKEYAILSKLMPHSSLAEIDPSKDRSVYQVMKDGETGEDMQNRLAEYDKLLEWYDKLGEEGQAHYRRLRNMFRQLYRDGWTVLSKRLEKEVQDPEVRAQLSKNLWERIYSNGIIDPYFPLARKGKYWLAFNSIDPVSGRMEFFTMPVDTKADRDRIMQQIAEEMPARLRESSVGRGAIAAQMTLKNDDGTPRYATEEEAIAAVVDLQQSQRIDDIDYRRSPPTSFVNEVVQTLEGNQVDQTTINAVMQLYLNALPEKSLLQSFRIRKGVRGFAGDVGIENLVPKADILDAYAEKAKALNRQLISIEYGAELADFKKKMKDEVEDMERRGESIETPQAFRAVLNDMASFASAPNISTWSKVATSIGFGMTLGLNFSSAMLNLMQLPMIVAPYLSGRYGAKDTFAALTEAFTIFRNSARPHDVEYFSDTQGDELVGRRRVEGKVYTAFHPSLDNYDFDDPNGTLARQLGMSPEEVQELRVLREVMGELGNLHRSITEDVLDMDGLTGDNRTEKALQFANGISGWMFHHTEKINRQVTAIAAYRLAVKKAKKDGKEITPALLEQLARDAVNDTELTNGSAASAAAPSWAQSSLGKVLFLFKRFGLAMYGIMAQLTRDSFKGADAQTKDIAQKQLAGIFGGAALFSGAQGMPLFGALALIHDLTFGEEDEDDFETQVRKTLGEGLYGGIGNYALGVDLASRIGLSDLVFRSNPMAKEQDPLYDLIEMALGPVGGVYFSMRRGAGQIAEGDMERGIEAMMPAAFRNVMKSVRLYTEGARTLRGDAIVDEIGPYSALMQGFGFAPAEYIRQLEQNANLKRIDKGISRERSRILRRMYRARREGNMRELQGIMGDLVRFNQRNPQAAITMDTIDRSMRSHLRTSQRMHHGVTFGAKNEAFLRRNAAEYDRNITLWDDTD